MRDRRETRRTPDAGGSLAGRDVLAVVLGVLLAYTVGRTAHGLADGWVFGPVLAATVGVAFGLIALLAVRGQD